ncbi:MAG: reactive intermediate/imine deaminase, partial [Firmicutes bacterium]|nr:reactive intermediate/imine deaminase [Bacillota bacterium]
IIEACGSCLEKTVKVTIFLTDMDNFATVNGIYSEYFSQEPPARACVEVSRLPKNVAVEMDAVVLCD